MQPGRLNMHTRVEEGAEGAASMHAISDPACTHAGQLRQAQKTTVGPPITVADGHNCWVSRCRYNSYSAAVNSGPTVGTYAHGGGAQQHAACTPP